MVVGPCFSIRPRKIRERYISFFREEWPFQDERTLINRHIAQKQKRAARILHTYIYIYIFNFKYLLQNDGSQIIACRIDFLTLNMVEPMTWVILYTSGFLLLVVMPFVTSSFLLLVVMPGATSSFLLLVELQSCSSQPTAVLSLHIVRRSCRIKMQLPSSAKRQDLRAARWHPKLSH